MVLPNHYWTAPVAALVLLGVVVLILRWVFAPPRPRAQRPPPPPVDYGLLVPVAAAPTAPEAERLRAVLASAGIRCTVGPPGADGTREVLVFRADAARAGELARG